MLDRRIPEWLRHAPTPGVRGFAVLSGFEAAARGILISVLPIAVYDVLQDARTVSALYFAVGVLSLVTGLLVPWIIRYVPRRWVYSVGCLAFASGAILATLPSPLAIFPALALITGATVVIFVCFNAYVLDYIQRSELDRCETSRLFYSALGWTAGPAAGVTLRAIWAPAPFLISAAAMLTMLAVFLYLRLGNGRLIIKSTRPPLNPLAFLPRFFAQPRLIAGWVFAVVRSCGWWVYVVYLPIFAVQSGMSAQLGGWLLSGTNACLFAAPAVLRWMKARSVRHAVRTGFFSAGVLFIAATALAGTPPLAVLALVGASACLIVLDVSAGLPFLLAVKPSERTEMSAIYASYRDVSGIATPGAAWLVLQLAPLAAIFAATGTALIASWALAGRLHPRLGRARISIESAPEAPGPIAAADPML